MNTIVQVEGLRKVYGSTVAVDDISFEVKEGEIFGMVGPNGAGKTTTIECLEGLRKPDAGTIRVLGVDPQHDGHTLRERTGMQLQQSNLPDRMKVWEALDLYASFYPKAADWKELLIQLGLEDKRNAAYPDAPTFREMGLDVVMGVYYPIVAPKNLPADVKDGPLVCRHRPSVDVLFRSAARSAFETKSAGPLRLTCKCSTSPKSRRRARPAPAAGGRPRRSFRNSPGGSTKRKGQIPQVTRSWKTTACG